MDDLLLREGASVEENLGVGTDRSGSKFNLEKSGLKMRKSCSRLVLYVFGPLGAKKSPK